MRAIRLGEGDVLARAEGTNEMRDGIPVLTRIHVHYSLRVSEGVRDKVDRALASHVAKCPTARSLVGAVEITWDADVTEVPA